MSVPQIAAKIPEVVETKIHEEIVGQCARIVPQARLVHLLRRSCIAR